MLVGLLRIVIIFAFLFIHQQHLSLHQALLNPFALEGAAIAAHRGDPLAQEFELALQLGVFGFRSLLLSDDVAHRLVPRLELGQEVLQLANSFLFTCIRLKVVMIVGAVDNFVARA